MLAWDWTEYFYAEGDAQQNVGSHQEDETDQSYSYIDCHTTGVTFARADIWGNEWPDHLLQIHDPQDETVYFNWEDQQFDLFGHSGEMEVIGGDFEASYDFVKIHIEYPY